MDLLEIGLLINKIAMQLDTASFYRVKKDLQTLEKEIEELYEKANKKTSN